MSSSPEAGAPVAAGGAAGKRGAGLPNARSPTNGVGAAALRASIWLTRLRRARRTWPVWRGVLGRVRWLVGVRGMVDRSWQPGCWAKEKRKKKKNRKKLKGGEFKFLTQRSRRRARQFFFVCTFPFLSACLFVFHSLLLVLTPSPLI